MTHKEYEPVQRGRGDLLVEVPLVKETPITGNDRLILDGVII